MTGLCLWIRGLRVDIMDGTRLCATDRMLGSGEIVSVRTSFRRRLNNTDNNIDGTIEPEQGATTQCTQKPNSKVQQTTTIFSTPFSIPCKSR